ncbi:uncharacterized protein LOC123560434 isoform X2 [Mercenaria mercenaria]|uniref:uncharacterized protein LOC123560434 isoform X2 n=1 Tax=Mercenaria mercenaria TaxID=6596 RepID=UPI00234EE76F|nr:uncharacterized protein LOC123560434 isoform X2 [Mercenaria mercenaria]
MSVYKIGNEPDIGHDEETEKSCLGLEYQQVSKIFKWQLCSEYLRPLCAYIDSETNTDDKHYPWEVASNECFKRQTIPTSYETAEQFKTVLTGIYWTGTIRSQGIYSRGLRKTQAHDLYGYLTKNTKNMTFVMFTKENKKLKGLCQIDDSGHKTSGGSVPVEEIGIGVAMSILVIVIIGFGVYKWRKRKQQSRGNLLPTGVGGEVSGARYGRF